MQILITIDLDAEQISEETATTVMMRIVDVASAYLDQQRTRKTTLDYEIHSKVVRSSEDA